MNDDTKSRDRKQLRSLTDADLGEATGGFNPQPDPPIIPIENPWNPWDLPGLPGMPGMPGY